MDLGENIYRLRAEKNMSQGDLADALDVSRQSVSKWENNSAVPELEKLIKMSELFGVTLDELVGKEKPQAPEPAPDPVPQSRQEPTPAPVPPAAAGITTGDLISVVLLIFGVTIPLVVLFTTQLHNSLILMVGASIFIPLLVTVGAACCSPKSRLLFKIYVAYDILACILDFSLLMGAPQLGVVVTILYLAVIAFWMSRLE